MIVATTKMFNSGLLSGWGLELFGRPLCVCLGSIFSFKHVKLNETDLLCLPILSLIHSSFYMRHLTFGWNKSQIPVLALHSVVSSGDHGIYCWWDLIRLKQLSSVSVCRAQVIARFSGHGNSIHNIIPLLKKENVQIYWYYR